MSHHHMKHITECVKWCNRCQRQTRHHVSGGREQHCLEHGPDVNARGENKKQEAARKRRDREAEQQSLFMEGNP